MSFGHSYKCDSCKFTFWSGWSHHEGGESCVCRACGEAFRIVSLVSCWGPSAGELLPVMHMKRSGKRGVKVEAIDTGLRVQAEPAESGGKFKLVRLRVEDIRCHKCAGELTLSLSAGESCPKCHQGHILNQGEVEY